VGDVAVSVLERLRNVIWIPGGTLRMGSDKHYPKGAPAHRVTLGNFWINRTAVTNRQFRKCINEVGYVTPGCEGLSWRAAAHPESRLAGVHAAESSGRSAGFQIPRQLAKAMWPAQLNQQARQSPSRSHAEADAKWAGKELLAEAECETDGNAQQRSPPFAPQQGLVGQSR
jgi:formylglycine-generating enzyme required for sulfatase activity